MRTKKRILKNSFIEIIIFLLTGIVEFLKIRYFVQFAGSEFNGYYSFIEQLMAYLFLAEAGLSAGIIYTLYKPINNSDNKKISAIYNGAKKIYKKITIAMTILLLLLMAVSPFLVKGNNLLELEVSIFTIGLSNLIGYLFYSRTFLCLASAYQRKYTYFLINGVIKILTGIVAILVVYYTKSLVFVALNILFFRIIQEFVFYLMTKTKYKNIDSKEKPDLSSAKMTSDLLVHQIGELVSNNIDMVILMVIQGPVVVSVYATYNYILRFLSNVFSKISSNVVHAFGQIFIQKDEKSVLKAFKQYILFSFAVANFFAVNFYFGIKMFVGFWIGKEAYILNNFTIALFSSVLFLTVFYAPMIAAITANGLFKESKYFSLITSFINLILSLIFVRNMGLAGVLLATIISYFVSMLFRSILISKKVFISKKSVHWFFIYLFGYLILLVQLYFISILQGNKLFIAHNIISWFILMLFFSLFYILIILICLFMISKDFRLYLKKSFKKMKKIIKKIMIFIIGLIPKNKKKIIFESVPDMVDSSKSIYDYMKQEGFNYKYYWMVSNPNKFKKDKDTIYLNVNKKYSIRNIYHLVTSKYIFFTHRDFLFTNVKKQTVINLTHGIGIKDSKGKLPENFTKVLCGSEESSYLACDQYNCLYENLLINGLPRDDVLFKVSERDIDIKSQYNKIIFWFPTYRVHKNLKKAKLTNPFLIFNQNDLKKLDRFLIKENILLYFQPHHAQKQDNILKNSYQNIIIINDDYLGANNLELFDIMRISDAMITDYSSLGNDFILLDRPLGYILFDIDEYLKDNKFVFNNYNKYLPGTKIHSKEDFYNFIEDLIKGVDNYSEQRKEIRDFYWDNKNNNTEKIVELIFKS